MIRFFLERHLLVNVITIIVLALGLFFVTGIQREGFPAVTINEVVITSVLPGASPQDVEAKLTVPIEDAVRELDGVQSFHSVSRESTSVVTVELHDDFSPREVRDAERDIQRAIDAIQDLPTDMDAPPVLFRFDPAKMSVLELGITGPRAQVRTVAEKLERELERLAGVGGVTPVAYADDEIQVLLDPIRAKSNNVTLEEVMGAISRRNVASTGGRLYSYPSQRQVVLSGEYRSAEDVRDTILRFGGESGGTLRVRDVARVVEGTKEIGLIAHSEGEASINLVVTKRASADILDQVDTIRGRVDEYDLPPGVAIHYYNDRSEQTRNRLDVVMTNGIGGVVLVLLVLLAFLNVRVAGWVSFGLPFALLGVMIFLPLVGITINMVSLAAFVVVIGLVVDDAIIVAERIAFHLEKGLEPMSAAVKGAREMALPVIGAAITTILAFLPMFMIGGLPGKFSGAIPVIVILTLLVSLFECFFILPAHLTGGRHKPKPKARWVVALELRYQRVLRKVLERAGLVVVAFAVLFVGSVEAARRSLPATLFPQDDSAAVYLKIRSPIGTPLETTEAYVSVLEQQIPALLGSDLEGLTARVGHAEPYATSRNDGSSDSEALISVYLERDRRLGAHEWIDILRRDLVVPGELEVVYEARRIGPPMGRPVTVHVAADTDDERRRAVARVMTWLEQVDDVVDIETDERPGIRQVDLLLRYERLALRGVSVEQVAQTVKAAFYGIPVSEQRELDNNRDIRVRLAPAARGNLDLLLSMPVRSDNGTIHALREFVEPVDVDALAQVHHRDGERTTTISAALASGSDQTSTTLARRIEAELMPAFEQRPGVRVRVGGEAEKSADTFSEIPYILALAIGGIILVVMLLTGSLTQAMFVITAVPLGMIGVIWAFIAHGVPISMFALLGVVGLCGVVVNDSIVMVTSLDRTGADASSTGEMLDAVAAGAAERLRPVLLTTLTTVAGVMPTAYGLGGRDALLSPMSMALGYGLIFATTITLLLVPSLYVIRRRLDRVLGGLWGRLRPDSGPGDAPPPSTE